MVFVEPHEDLTIVQGDILLIQWQDEDPDDDAHISLAYDLDDDPLNDEQPQWIIEDLSEDMDETGDQYEWDTADIPAGEYYLWAVISDGNNEPLYVVSPVRITLQEGQDSSDQPTPEIPAEPTTEPVEQPTEEPTEEPTQQPTEEPTQPAEVGNEYYSLSSRVMGDGRVLNQIIINGPAEAPAGFTRATVSLPLDAAGEIQTTQSMAALIVPAFNWSFGCSATSAAMIAGYYDRNGFDNMYAGPTNGGLMPLDNSS